MGLQKYNMDQAVKITVLDLREAPNLRYVGETRSILWGLFGKSWFWGYRPAGWKHVFGEQIYSVADLEAEGYKFIDGKPHLLPKITITFSDGSTFEKKFDSTDSARNHANSLTNDFKWLKA